MTGPSSSSERAASDVPGLRARWHELSREVSAFLDTVEQTEQETADARSERTDEGGEYRTYYLSPEIVREERRFFDRYETDSISGILDAQIFVLEAFLPLLAGVSESPVEDTENALWAMSEVLKRVVRGLADARELCDGLVPVATHITPEEAVPHV